MGERVGTVVVGAGIVGLATAREVLLRDARAEVLVVDKEEVVAAHQTSHNSGVVHSGVYYAPGSAKAELCVSGARAMLRFCEENRIPVRVGGKLIVAVDEAELAPLAELERRAAANGVPDLRRLGPAQIAQVEPHAHGVAALHVPGTAVTDFAAVARALGDDFVARGGRLELGFPVSSVTGDDYGVTVRADDGRHVRARQGIVCAGLQSDRLAGYPADVRILPFRGSYYALGPRAVPLVRSMIYPVPDPRFPFLGTHFTRHFDDTVSCGPNAILALAREEYSRWSFSTADAWDSLRFPGSWRLARKHWSTGVRELADEFSKRRSLRQARRYLPDLEMGDLTNDDALGVRAQAVDRGGRLVSDFVLRRTGPLLHVLNAPSPAATASLAIAERIVDRISALGVGGAARQG
ncbi:MAG: L-2-hydroxyglutarate oxidase [Actinomycetota bacterium]|nr:L-2-hydroxyglutarate oxidase [Actinomycetota bacterium]